MTAEQQPNPFRPPDENASPVPPAGSAGPPQGAAAATAVSAGPARVPWQAAAPAGGPGTPHPPPAPGYAGPPGGSGALPQWGHGWPPPRYAPRNTPGTAALVLGVVGASLCWTFVLSPVTLVLGLLALILGFTGIRRAGKGDAGRRAALGGLWTGAGTTLISLVLTVVLVVWSGASVAVETEAGSEYLATQGEEVGFENGVRVVFDAPRAGADGDTIVLSLKVTNTGEETAAVTTDRLRVWIGEVRVPETDVERSGAPGSLAPGAMTRLTFRIGLDSRGADGDIAGDIDGDIDVDYAPGEDYDWGYWEFDLPALVGRGGDDGTQDLVGGLEA